MLRHAPIRSKVVAILILPLAGLVALAAVGIGTTLARGAEAGRRNDLAQLAVRGNTRNLLSTTVRMTCPAAAPSP